MKLIKIFILLSFMSNAILTFSLDLPKPETFEIKKINDLKILYVHHHKEQGHISNSLVKLVQYYLLNDDNTFKVVFPQFSVERLDINGSFYAIEYKGDPAGNDQVKKYNLKGGLFASYIYKGSYTKIKPVIKKVIQKIIKTGKYFPDKKNEIRLLYWNSIDDNYPSELITEIQIRIKMK